MHLSFVAALLLAWPAPPARQAPPVVTAHRLTAPPRRARVFDLQHVALDLTLDWSRRRAEGSATLTLVPLVPLDRIALDAAHLGIERITLDGRTVARWTWDGTDRDGALEVLLPHQVPAGRQLQLQIAYHTTWVNQADPTSLGGSNGRGLRFFGPTVTEPRKRMQVWSMGESVGNRYWFPGYDAPDDLATSELRVRVPDSLTVVANGRLAGSRRVPGTARLREFHFRQDRPHPTPRIGLAAGQWRPVEARQQGVLLQSVGYPDERDAVAASVVRLPDMLAFFARVTGTPYPGTAYRQVFLQDMPWGVGATGLGLVTENMVDDYRTHEDYRYLWDGLEAEALAAQWFGSLVSIQDWRHAWLARGFAHYMDGLFSEHRNGREEFLLWNMRGDATTYLAEWSSGTRTPVAPAIADDAGTFAVGNTPYVRGAMVLHLLRATLGDSLWWRVVRTWVREQAGRAPATPDFQRLVERVAGRPLDWFFDQWVHGVGHPSFDVSQRWDEPSRQLTLTVRQVQRPDTSTRHPQVEFFQGAMDLALDGRIVRVWLAPRAENTFTWTLDAAPALVAFDVGSAWIKEVRFDKPLEALVHQVSHDPDVTGRLWALGEVARVARDTARGSGDRASARAAIRHVARHDTFWRMRYSALLQLQGLLTPATPGEALVLDPPTRDLLEHVVRTERSWVRSVAFGILGLTRDPQWAQAYIAAFADSSHPVNYAAAIALGQSRNPLAFDALTQYMRVPSWKGENVLCGLAGLKALGDRRAVSVALEAFRDTTRSRWYLSTSRWDYRMAAMETLVALGAAGEVWPDLERRYRRSLEDGDMNDIFSNAQLAAMSGDPRAEGWFGELRTRFGTDALARQALDGFEGLWARVRQGT